MIPAPPPPPPPSSDNRGAPARSGGGAWNKGRIASIAIEATMTMAKSEAYFMRMERMLV
ncbi:MAG: hypothetical protein GKC05_04435, partial [Methanomicrobiales archaeon]|nr:hypothetical protein [Methanomicrobiales archaeon]